MRITDVDGGFRVELVPDDVRFFKAIEKSKNGERHRCWWESGGGDELVSLSPVLRRIKAVKLPLSFVLNDAGEMVP
jgi:hypothetical protein